MSERPGDDFEGWLEHELRQVVTPIRGQRPRADQAAYRAAPARRSSLSSGVRSAVAVAAVGLALIGGLTGAAAVMGSPDPVSLGRLVVHAVRADERQNPPSMPSVQGMPVITQTVPQGPSHTPAPSPSEGRASAQGQDGDRAQGGSQNQDGSSDQGQQGVGGNAKHPAHSPRPTPPGRDDQQH